MNEKQHTPTSDTEDLGSQNDYILYEPGLADVLSAVQTETGELREQNQQLQEELELDPKTGLLNAVAFEAKMQKENRGGTLMLFDLDFFKQINEKFQYVVADERFLKPAAQALKDNVRHGNETTPGDLVGRFGGEEFVIFLRGATPANSTYILKRIYTAINACEFGNDNAGNPITIAGRAHLGASVGIVSYPAGSDYKERLDAANVLLNTAKHDGRNTYVMEEGDETPDAQYPLPVLDETLE